MRSKTTFKVIGFIMVLALASISCGVSDLPFMATETPTATATYTPSPTSTPTQTPTSTPTNTPTSTPLPTGVTSEEQADGSKLFIDYDNQYQLALPADWFIIPFDRETLSTALDELAEQNPNLAASAEAFKNLDPNTMRMVAINADMQYFVNGVSSNITIAAIEDATLSALPLSFITGALEESFKQQGITVLTSGVNIVENDHGVDVEYIDVEQNVNGERIQQRVVVFKTSAKLIVVTMTTLPQFADEMFDVNTQVGASVELLQ